MFLQRIRRYSKSISAFTLLGLSIEMFGPSIAYSIDGPKQPEVKTFTPIGTSDMVDHFTGNFNYNIPLLDVGGYPINISYNANPTMEQDASWVGLGWTLNVGNIDRSMRGLPDDFSGDSIVKVRNKKANQTMGLNASFNISDIEIYGLELGKLGLSAGASLGVFRNNYTGSGSVVGLNLGLDLALASANKDEHTISLGASATSNSDEGETISPSISYSNRIKKENNQHKDGSFSLGTSFNTEKGWRDLSFGYGVSVSEQRGQNNSTRLIGKKNGGSSISFAHPALPPQVSMPTYTMGLSFNTTFGGEAFGIHAKAVIRANYSVQSLKDDKSFAIPGGVDEYVPGFMAVEQNLINDVINFPSLFKDNAKVVLPSYGYLYSHNGAGSDKVIHDFNREKDGAFTVHRPNLPIPNFTHDIYNVTGQGIGGMYRPVRNDIGILHDPAAESSSTNIDFPGLEIGGGNAVHVGANFGVTTSSGYTRKWNPGINGLGFKGFTSDDPSYQPYYFRQAGEKTASFSTKFFEDLGGYDPVRVKLGEDLFSIVQAAVDPLGFFSGDATVVKDEFKQERLRNPIGDPAIPSERKPYRQPRNQDIQFLNAKEAQRFGLEKYIRSYRAGGFNMNKNGSYSSYSSFTRVSNSLAHRMHHISEITALTSNGARYVYGIPVYNRYQKDVSFAVECNNGGFEFSGDCAQGIIKYEAGDNSTNNEKGIDHHFESEETPGYPHSFLLTAILSDDYVDVTENGPTDDDLGSYTKFNYSRTDIENEWRMPFGAGTANYSEGYHTDHDDGRASYSYGTRELWYLHSIVTKTHVAEFVLEDRDDAIGAAGEEGGPGDGRMKKLTKIRVYAKPEKLKEAKSNGAYKAVPLKTVHFEYDYSLCPGVPNNINHGNADADIRAKGKLTLKKIYFTFQNSNKAILSPYTFSYGYSEDGTKNALINPRYSEKAQDRWGSYKPHQGGDNCVTSLTNTDFPYSDQNKEAADLHAAAWNLTKIVLPSGAIMKITYESDDYAYVQNKPAMQMFPLVGIGSSKDAPIDENTLDEPVALGSYLFFKLPQTLTGIGQADADIIIRDRYLKQIAGQQEKLYFRCFVQMDGDKGGDLYDYVPGYADLDLSGNDGYGAVPDPDNSSSFRYGYVKIKGVKAGKASDYNPIRKSAINLVKMNLRMLLKDSDDNVYCGSNFGDDIKALILSTGRLLSAEGVAMFTYDHFDKPDNPIAKHIRLNKSMIRLFNPYQNKLGGGSRVKRITVSDDWNTMTGGEVSVYGQEYEYTMPDGTGGVMSSGVAAYEPVAGGEENPFRQPVFFDEERLGVPDEEYFLEEPMGETFFPAPSVGYSRVTVKDISLDSDGNVTYNKTGKVVHEFYTAYNFPTRTDDTHLDYRRHRPTLLAQILKLNVEDYATVSQGYVVELNDMHGKPRSRNIYPEQDPSSDAAPAPVSSVIYLYKTDPVNGRLDNDVLVMNKTAVTGKNEFIEKRTIGVDYDFITDFRENETSTKVVTTQGNVETFFAAIFPIIVPIILPELQSENVRFRSAVTSKVINRYGLLEKTITQDLGKQDTLTNVLYDAETGEVLLTQRKNQFDDSVFAMNLPAHFAYEGMGPSYKNSGTVLSTDNLDNISNASNYFIAGDEVLVFNKTFAAEKKTAYFKGWVDTVMTDGTISIIDEEGLSIKEKAGDGPYVVKVLRSGRRNLQSNSIGRIVTLSNPLSDPDGDGKYTLVFDKVLDAQSIEYNSSWKTFCSCGENIGPPEDNGGVVIR